MMPPAHLSLSAPISIRAVRLSDGQRLSPLLEQLGYPMSLEIIEDRLSHYTSFPDYMLFVAETSEYIIGLIALSMHQLFLAPSKKGVIEALVIDKFYRGQNIGRQLMAQAEAHAKGCGCSVIELTSGLRRAPEGTHDFYKKLGYENEGPYAKLYLRKNLA
jgi:GNAT superfamily N-acetyltransferase